ncbi:GntR family transcriptional regulator [Alcanivorax sp. JB21]|uniref:GntR family transcriptional regulator n=1 Tax=Alcanivorax limicola TaxID=2874102 RepID=UPI001CBC72AE|nr:GntR family transcriptional regulator [Alcanivorax limicola]MBZ2189012.1 GntR family transcriptional regulator [Alcanivorax limicola]
MPLKATSLSEQIAEHLGDRIIRGELAPGAKLPESELAKQLNVSTNSLREAFRVLEGRHLIEIQPRRGARVCDVNEEQVRELYDFLFLLLSQLAARAAETWQAGEVEDLAKLVPQLEERHENGDLAGAHQLVFQWLPDMLRFARNTYMARTISDMIPLLQRYSFIALTEETTEFDVSITIFQRLLGNVLMRKADDAAAAIQEYGDNQCRIVLRAIAKRSAAA